jgi:hypothetical protein
VFSVGSHITNYYCNSILTFPTALSVTLKVLAPNGWKTVNNEFERTQEKKAVPWFKVDHITRNCPEWTEENKEMSQSGQLRCSDRFLNLAPPNSLKVKSVAT